MDIVEKIGRYFAQHEQHMSEVMKQALERSRDKALSSTTSTEWSSLEAIAPIKPTPPSIPVQTKPKNRVPTPPPLPSPVQAAACVVVPVPPSSITLLKSKPKLQKKKKAKKEAPSPTPPSTSRPRSRSTNLEEAWRVTCDRVKKIQMEQTMKQKQEEEFARHEQAKRQEQLAKLESIRKQAFAQQSKLSPAQKLECSEAWSEPPRRLIPTRKSNQAFKTPTPPPSTPLVAAPARQSSPRQSSIQALDKAKDTPFLDQLEAQMKAQRLQEAAICRQMREVLEQAKVQESRQRERIEACRAQEARNHQLARTIDSLKAEKAALENSLQGIQNEHASMRAEKQRLVMERRLARRQAAANKRKESLDANAIEKLAKEELARADKAKYARELAKRRVQQRQDGPEIVSDDELDEQEETWRPTSPLADWDRAFFTYSSSSSSDEGNG
ncbi:hypothetical protein AC1031_003646 [Aphanomyces cochlioides]|nr:hypothetical protein AC1031_003646 [Aphanomyces cochlioides]